MSLFEFVISRVNLFLWDYCTMVLLYFSFSDVYRGLLKLIQTLTKKPFYRTNIYYNFSLTEFLGGKTFGYISLAMHATR